MKSIIQKNKNHCFICQKEGYLEDHHIYFGPNRKISEKYGLKVWLCYEHHRGTNGVHGKNGNFLNEKLKKEAQRRFEFTHTREEFIQLIGKSYLD